MKNKLFTLLIALMASVGTMFASVEIGGIAYNLSETEQIAEVTSKTFPSKYSGDIVIPSTILYNGITYNVTSIGNHAFNYCTALTSVTIPNSVTNIGDDAFVQCTHLISVTIPESVTSIGAHAFSSCTGLTSVTIPNSVTSIGEYAFSNCSSLTSIEIPNSVKSIGGNAFSSCTGLTSVTIPNSVKSIGNSAFSYCIGLPSITIPESVTSIGNYAFSNVANIVYSGIATGSPWGARSINGYVEGYLVYKDNTKTELLACPISAKGEIIIPNSVTSIGGNAFLRCTGLTSVTIGNSVKSIGDYAFRDCISLTSIEIPISVTSIGDYAFIRCTGLTSVTIGNSVTSIGGYAFAYCKNLISITIPNSVTSIGEFVFLECNSLNTINVDNNNPNYSSIDGVLYNKAQTSLIFYPTGNSRTEYIIPNGVTSIGENAFIYCRKLRSIEIPNSITDIGNRAFLRCIGLTSIKLPNNLTTIRESVFRTCINLTSVVIPNNVTTIEKSAFQECSNMISLSIPNSVTNIEENAFFACYSLISIHNYSSTPQIINNNVFGGSPQTYSYEGDTVVVSQVALDKSNCTLYVPAESVEAYKAADVWNEFGNILPIEKTKDYLSIAEAIEIGMALDSMATSEETYTIEGYVINAASFNSKYKTQSWYMADDVYATSSSFQAYGCYPIYGEDTVAVINGNKVRMTGKLQKYYNKSIASYLVEMTRVPATIIAEPQVADTLTIAEALAIGAELPAGGFTPVKYVIRGYVSYINAPFDETTGCETFYITDDISTPAYSNQTGGFYIYRGSPVTGEAIAQGALVEITTAIYNYHGTIIENYGQQIPVTVIQEAPECYTLTGICGDNLTWTLSTCDGLLTISGTGATYNYSKDNVAPWVYYDVQSAVIENGVTALGTYAFYKCSMSSVSIPASVTNIAFNTFNNCYILMNFMVDPGNLVYSSVDGVLFNKDQTIIVRYPRGRKGEYTIPDGVVIVGEGAFNGCYNVTNVTIPNSVTTLGCAAFFSCGMSSITIPANVNRIDSLVFVGCQYLNVVTNYAIEPQVINTNVFDGDIDMSKCTLYVQQQSLAAYQAANVWKDFGTILPIDEPIEPEEANFNVIYIDSLNNEIQRDSVILHLPVAPMIEGFTFLKWQVVAGDLEDGIFIQAVYTADESFSAPEVYTNPANSAQKLIRNGNVYILTGDKVYTVTGQEVR